jgi:nickel-dependent lactate racemase
MTAYTLPWGDERLPLDLPETWQVVGFLEPNAVSPVDDPAAAIAESLANPIGLAPLPDLIQSDFQITIVLDDISRPTPVHLVAPQVLACQIGRAHV